MDTRTGTARGRGRNAGIGARDAGFSLMEMIIVMVIIAAIAVAVVPNVASGLGGTRTQIAARGLVQMSRYARSMALANQTEVELTVSSNGILRVRAAPHSMNFSNRGMPGENDAYGNAAMARAGGPGGGSARQESAASLESAIALEKKFDQAEFAFEGYTDGLGRMLTGREDKGAEDRGSVVTFRSNGVCKPRRFLVSSPGGHSLHVSLGMTGKGKIELEPE